MVFYGPYTQLAFSNLGTVIPFMTKCVHMSARCTSSLEYGGNFDV
jgi:hypothetical protein